MSRNRSTGAPGAEPAPIAAPPTQPRPVGAQGHALDAEGLPLSGPARARAIAARAVPAPTPDQES